MGMKCERGYLYRRWRLWQIVAKELKWSADSLCNIKKKKKGESESAKREYIIVNQIKSRS